MLTTHRPDEPNRPGLGQRNSRACAPLNVNLYRFAARRVRHGAV